MERLNGIHLCLSPDDKAGGGQPVLPGMENQLPLPEESTEDKTKSKGRGGRYKHPQGHTPIIRAPQSVYEREPKERKDID
jgi:hypothetical protein